MTSLSTAPPRAVSLRLLFVSLVVITLLSAMDATIVATALPSIVADIGGERQIGWVFAAYTLSMTVAMPVFGRLGDLRGRRSLYLWSIAAFVLASVLCGFAADLGQLIALRFAQGIAGGGLLVLGQAVVADAVPARERREVPRAHRLGVRHRQRGVAAARRRAHRHGRLAVDLLGQRADRRCGAAPGLRVGAAQSGPQRTGERLDVPGAALLAVWVTGDGAGRGLGRDDLPLDVVRSCWRPRPSPSSPSRCSCGAACGTPTRSSRCRCSASGPSSSAARSASSSASPCSAWWATCPGSCRPPSVCRRPWRARSSCRWCSASCRRASGRDGGRRAPAGTGAFPSPGAPSPPPGWPASRSSGRRPRRSLVGVCAGLIGVGVGSFGQVTNVAVQDAVPARLVGTATSTVALVRELGVTLGAAALGGLLSARLLHGLGPLGDLARRSPEQLRQLPPALRHTYGEAYLSAMTPLFAGLALLFAAGAVVALLPARPRSSASASSPTPMIGIRFRTCPTRCPDHAPGQEDRCHDGSREALGRVLHAAGRGPAARLVALDGRQRRPRGHPARPGVAAPGRRPRRADVRRRHGHAARRPGEGARTGRRSGGTPSGWPRRPPGSSAWSSPSRPPPAGAPPAARGSSPPTP